MTHQERVRSDRFAADPKEVARQRRQGILLPVKNTALFLVAALDLFLYSYPKPPAVVAPVRVAAVAPKPVAPRTYFHSSLNAPAMPASAYTSMGYFSTDPSSEFRGDSNVAVATVTSSAVNTGELNWGDPAEAADIGTIQKVYKLPKVGEARPTISQ